MKRITLLLCLPAICLADRWTVDDLLFSEGASQFELSKDAKMAVYAKSAMDREKGESVSHLVLRYLSDGHEVRLTRGQDSANSPKFAPDGKRIAFLMSRRAASSASDATAPQGPQVWMLDLRGGEPWQLTSLERGVRSFSWLDDGAMLLVAQEDPTYYDQTIRQKKDTSQVVDDEAHASPVRLFRFDVKKREARRLSENADRIQNANVSPDGAWAVTTHDRSLRYVYDQSVKPVNFLYDLKTGAAKQLFADGKLRARQVSWKPDSKGFFFTSAYTTHPKFENAAIDLLYEYDLASAQAVKVNLDWDRALGGSIAATPTGVAALLADGVYSKPAHFVKEGGGWKRTWITGEHARNIFGMELSEDGKTILYPYSTTSTPLQWYQAEFDGAAISNPKKITDLNPAFARKTLSKGERIRWKGAKDEEVEGLLNYPLNYEPGKKYPLVVMIHGGPHGADVDSWSERWGYPVHLMAQRGAFVMRPNYHGSSRYGLAWGESISGGNYNDFEWLDVEKGVDTLIAKGLVDPDKLGVMGWSNGSIITIELTTRTTRYKAAGAGAGNVNWLSDWGNAVFGESFDHYYLGTTPLKDPQFYLKKSPLFRMDKVKTPTIIFFGTEDKQVPTEQGWQHYRALQQLGNTDVKFILFPGEAHGPRKLVHQRRKVEEELAWFDKYLFGVVKDENEALKTDSPLSAALRLSKNAKFPEVVERGKIHIGRFEVTRAQFRAFDPSYSFPAGTGHYPAAGISLEKAKAYCEWLSGQTGQKFRLGTEEEMASHLRANKNENTLDQWAGYAVNADDEKKLASLVEGLGAGALLRPAGSFAGAGEDPIYDLGGNAAEWVTTKDGSGKAMGGSADRPADAKSARPARPEYVGFRVVRE
ncbi:MAG: prolyl oligopeptidase family serine peptidase [Bryobacteraceae bacterium]|nr:prolyl oligopeptidase family serine peptidase [Bryobacteraceae bacterium]